MKAYIFTKYESDERGCILKRKVIVSDKSRFEIIQLIGEGSYDWEECDVEFQPERLNPEDQIVEPSEMVYDSLNTTNK